MGFAVVIILEVRLGKSKSFDSLEMTGSRTIEQGSDCFMIVPQTGVYHQRGFMSTGYSTLVVVHAVSIVYYLSGKGEMYLSTFFYFPCFSPRAITHVASVRQAGIFIFISIRTRHADLVGGEGLIHLRS